MRLRLREHSMKTCSRSHSDSTTEPGFEEKPASLQNSAYSSTSINAEPLLPTPSPGVIYTHVCPGLVAVPPATRPPLSQTTYCWQASQKKRQRERGDLSQGLMGASPPSPRPTHLPAETLGQEPAAQTRAAWISSRRLAPGAGSQVPAAAGEKGPSSLGSKVD